ncbi:MAG TPA: hypothetical protein VFY31_02075 [Macromonas sp.]|nr:hypothetical protein [Macromonas sp.]
MNLKSVFIVLASVVLTACAHPISINPSDTLNKPEKTISDKKVAYVMTDADRGKQVVSPGGGGDKISYYPYKDLEKVIRDVLSSVYADVSIINSSSNVDEIKSRGVSLVFTPEISTSSSSESIFTWPPTRFSIAYSSNVTDASGNLVSRIQATGTGQAEFSDFKSDFGLAGRRAASDMAKKLQDEIVNNPKLR